MGDAEDRPHILFDDDLRDAFAADRRPTGRSGDHYPGDVVVNRKVLDNLCDRIWELSDELDEATRMLWLSHRLGAQVTAERDALVARLALLLDAIGDPDELRVFARDGFDSRANGCLRRIADAAAAAREDR
jgi:hypothetical protein